MTTAEKKRADVNQRLRGILSDAYSFIRGAQLNESLSAVTLEALIQQHIEEIEGKEGVTALRPNKLDRVTRLMEEIGSAVKTAKELSTESFRAAADDPVWTEEPANTTEV